MASAANKILIILFSFLFCSCANNERIVLNPVEIYPSDYLCTNENINKAVVIPGDINKTVAKNNRKNNDYISATLRNAGLEIAANTTSLQNCLTVFKQGTSLFNKNITYTRGLLSKRLNYKKSNDVNIAKAQRDISYHWYDDQSARQTYIKLKAGKENNVAYWAHSLATANALRADNESTKTLERLLSHYDWIDIKRFGGNVSAHAWILIQHADEHVDLQIKALKRMESYLNTGGIRPSNYAYLWDRVAVNTGKKQRFGTQPIWECTTEGKLTLQALEDPENVNQRRAQFGLNTVEDGLANMENSVCQ